MAAINPPSASFVAQVEPQKSLASTPKMAFGKAAWEEHFPVDVGEEPPLPPNIEKILNGPCPIWRGKSVKETHLLTLVPKTVNREPLTLTKLGELVKSPKTGHATEYYYYSKDVKDEFGDASPDHSYWVLMTRDVIPGSRGKGHVKQIEMVKQLSLKQEISYTRPEVLEAAVSILMEHVRSGKRLYDKDPGTYTCCKTSTHEGPWPLCIGLFSPRGLEIAFSNGGGTGIDGAACCRKFSNTG